MPTLLALRAVATLREAPIGAKAREPVERLAAVIAMMSFMIIDLCGLYRRRSYETNAVKMTRCCRTCTYIFGQCCGAGLVRKHAPCSSEQGRHAFTMKSPACNAIRCDNRRAACDQHLLAVCHVQEHFKNVFARAL